SAATPLSTQSSVVEGSTSQSNASSMTSEASATTVQTIETSSTSVPAITSTFESANGGSKMVLNTVLGAFAIFAYLI
ncbi:hypothetical protein HANVADRAFT_3707, partial [Hanseniaspora valbyensis NRRL Y-1626]